MISDRNALAVFLWITLHVNGVWVRMIIRCHGFYMLFVFTRISDHIRHTTSMPYVVTYMTWIVLLDIYAGLSGNIINQWVGMVVVVSLGVHLQQIGVRWTKCYKYDHNANRKIAVINGRSLVSLIRDFSYFGGSENHKTPQDLLFVTCGWWTS